MHLIQKTFYFSNIFVDVHEVKLSVKTSLSIENVQTFNIEYLHGVVPWARAGKETKFKKILQGIKDLYLEVKTSFNKLNVKEKQPT